MWPAFAWAFAQIWQRPCDVIELRLLSGVVIVLSAQYQQEFPEKSLFLGEIPPQQAQMKSYVGDDK
jgi:hypothetical protein